MIANLISIGKSKAICLPDMIQEPCQLGNLIEFQVKDNYLEIHPVKSPRMDWDEQLARMAKYGDDKLLDNPTPTKWDETEWEW
jgi:antitoxin MazE